MGCTGAVAGLGNPQQEGGLSMSWQEGVAVAVVLFGLGAGAVLVGQRPSFWSEFGTALQSPAAAAGISAWRQTRYLETEKIFGLVSSG